MPQRVCNAILDRCPYGTSIMYADVVGKKWGLLYDYQTSGMLIIMRNDGKSDSIFTIVGHALIFREGIQKTPVTGLIG